MKEPVRRFRQPILLGAGTALVLAISLAVFKLMMAPPLAELELMALFLSITAVVSSAAAYGAYRLGWLAASPTIRWTLLAGYGLASVLTFFNVWFSARLMFASEHDLALSVVLLIFAGGMAMVMGYILSTTVIERVRSLKSGAEALRRGELQTRVPVIGQDEIATLSRAFNEMAEQLDAADRKQHELERLRADLIVWVSHDLQTPLASIRAILEALADGVVEDPKAVQRYLMTAQRDVRALSALIDDLFQMAQLDAGGIVLDLHPASLTDSDLGHPGKLLGTGSTPECEAQRADRTGRRPGAHGHHANRTRAQQPAGECPAAHSRWRARRSVWRAVRTPLGGGDGGDSGEGIPAEDLPEVFKRFYRGEKSRSKETGGAGLGLAIARGIVRAHQGDLTVESQPGQGSRFTFVLP